MEIIRNSSRKTAVPFDKVEIGDVIRLDGDDQLYLKAEQSKTERGGFVVNAIELATGRQYFLTSGEQVFVVKCHVVVTEE